jgi:hypothetical protein
LFWWEAQNNHPLNGAGSIDFSNAGHQVPCLLMVGDRDFFSDGPALRLRFSAACQVGGVIRD